MRRFKKSFHPSSGGNPGLKAWFHKPFILLEILIALSLFISCAIPLIYSPFNTMRIENRSLALLELQRHAENSFAEVKEKLYQNAFEWKELIKREKEAQTLDTKKIELNDFKALRFTQTTRLYTLRSKQGENGESYHLIAVELVFTPDDPKSGLKKKTITHKLFVTNLPSTLFEAPAIQL